MTYETLEPRRMLAAGDFDLAFAQTGHVETNIGTGETASQILVQADGKVLLAGTSKIGTVLRPVVIRYNADGTLDKTFGGGDGIFTLDTIGVNSFCNDMALRTDGKIIIAGNITFGRYFVARLRTDGVLDANSGFGGTDGLQTATGSLSEMELQGAQIILGNSNRITRLNSTGTIDTTFGSGGNRTLIPPGSQTGFVFNDLDIRPTGQIVATGTFQAVPPGDVNFFNALGVAQLTASGQTDTTFSGDGFGDPIVSADDEVVNGQGVIQADGKIVLFANQRTP